MYLNELLSPFHVLNWIWYTCFYSLSPHLILIYLFFLSFLYQSNYFNLNILLLFFFTQITIIFTLFFIYFFSFLFLLILFRCLIFFSSQLNSPLSSIRFKEKKTSESYSINEKERNTSFLPFGWAERHNGICTKKWSAPQL